MDEKTLSQNKPLDQDIKGRKNASNPRRKSPKRITESYLYNSGLAYLQRFPSSIPNFKRLMLRKINRSCQQHVDQSKDDCVALLEKTVARFCDMGLLNDEAYLTGMVTSLRGKGLSAQAISSKLAMKGFSRTAVADAVELYDSKQDNPEPELYAAIKYMRRKRLGAYDAAAKDKDKQLASLARAGFGFEIASKALRMDMEEIERISI